MIAALVSSTFFIFFFGSSSADHLHLQLLLCRPWQQPTDRPPSQQRRLLPTPPRPDSSPAVGGQLLCTDDLFLFLPATDQPPEKRTSKPKKKDRTETNLKSGEEEEKTETLLVLLCLRFCLFCRSGNITDGEKRKGRGRSTPPWCFAPLVVARGTTRHHCSRKASAVNSVSGRFFVFFLDVHVFILHCCYFYFFYILCICNMYPKKNIMKKENGCVSCIKKT